MICVLMKLTSLDYISGEHPQTGQTSEGFPVSCSVFEWKKLLPRSLQIQNGMVWKHNQTIYTSWVEKRFC